MYDADEHIFQLRQISVFLENRPGTLALATRVLADAGANLRALMIAETERFGILRLITDEPDAAVAALTAAGFRTRLTDVVGVEVPDRAGGLADLLGVFAGSEISVEYMYAELSGRAGRALLIMKVEPRDDALERLYDAALY
nr:ACT domain-containing protein [Propionibacterium sp.]